MRATAIMRKPLRQGRCPCYDRPRRNAARVCNFIIVGGMFMSTSKIIATGAACVMLASLASAQQAPAPAPAPQQPMSFFVTSVGKGNGADLGGLAGADAHCQSLAAAVGAGGKTWRAYLSAAATATSPAVNARDRIGAGPWFNARGQRIAQNVADLHGDTAEQARQGNNLNKQTGLNEKNEIVTGAGDTPNRHDILTGSNTEGRLMVAADGADRTCGNWTSGGTGFTMVGHHDRTGGGSTSWNSTHVTRSCSQPDLVATGGAGLFYCFAIN
jgi:hypothetical protein